MNFEKTDTANIPIGHSKTANAQADVSGVSTDLISNKRRVCQPHAPRRAGRGAGRSATKTSTWSVFGHNETASSVPRREQPDVPLLK